MEQPGFYDKGDLRSQNRELALKMVFRELSGLSLSAVHSILDKWKVREEEIGSTLSLSISFPAGVVRNQWFYDEQGRPFSKKHDGKDLKKKGKKK